MSSQILATTQIKYDIRMQVSMSQQQKNAIKKVTSATESEKKFAKEKVDKWLRNIRKDKFSS